MAPIAFIIGAGPGIGLSTAGLFKEKGYTVATGSRKPTSDHDEYFHVKVDATQQSSIQEAFARVNAELGTPTIVIYNVASLDQPDDPTDPLTLSVEAYNRSISIGSNVFVAAQEAVKGFRVDKTNNPKVFIATGNLLPALKNPPLSYFSLDIQKVISARLINNFATAYKDTGYRFFYTHLVSETGEIPPFETFLKSGPVNAQVFWDLVNSDETVWDYRFTPSGKKLGQYEVI